MNQLSFALMMKEGTFELQHNDQNSRARAGVFHTSRGSIETPIFMPVGTAGAVKAVEHRELTNDIEAQIILGNTYHLYLRPGIDVLNQAGGLHQFNNWQKPILTDSGGYQVYSLAANRKISEEGVNFKSHIDGSSHFFSPESAIEIQHFIGGDIIMAFDECTPYPCDYRYAKESMQLTHRWLDRCMAYHEQEKPKYGKPQFLFPIVQGSTYADLRKESAAHIASIEFSGYAIGGLSVGEPAPEMYEMTSLVTEILPADKPRYLMGVGTPANILESIALGVDMFDCVLPTRNARNGMLFTSEGIINIKNEKWKYNFNPIDPEIGGYMSTYFSRSYLRHLVISKEYLAAQIASVHNLRFYLWLVKQARKHIIKGDFSSWKKGMVDKVSRRL